MRKRKIKWETKRNKMIEQIYSLGLEYAFVSENYEQVHQLVMCKDFLMCTLFGFLNNRFISTYGYIYDPHNSPPIYLKKTRLLLTCWKDKNFKKNILNCLDFLHQIESELHMHKTKIELCCDNPPLYSNSGIWLLEGSRRWMISPPMFSLYTLLIRVGLVHSKGDSFRNTIKAIKLGLLKTYQNDNSGCNCDKEYLIEINMGFKHILKHTDKKIFYKNIKKNYEINNVYDLQDLCGIMGFSNHEALSYFPYWYRKEF